MKGIIFREFINMVEVRFGDQVADTIITQAHLPNNGAYTSVGTYPHSDLVQLLTQLSKVTNIAPAHLLQEFGKYVFQVFLTRYPHMFKGVKDGFTFLSLIENTIHTQVLKLYPEAELPSIDVVREKHDLKLMYHSNRKLSDFAEGLIIGCMHHFGEAVHIDKQFIEEDGSKVLFSLSKK
ncbi:MAG: heme NO-binding domain-containing protein [Marinilabiliaceae bacterium]|nr:heme NO-binding domain-containing protein [Marinilabiliaceae bacterium]